jgi:hypothetical protein
MPAAHCRNPQERESTESRDIAFLRLQDWAFTRGFALVKESVKTKNSQGGIPVWSCIGPESWSLSYSFWHLASSLFWIYTRPFRQYLEGIHHKKQTKNSQKLTEDNRERIGTRIQANDCKFSLVIAYSKAQEGSFEAIILNTTTPQTLILSPTFNTETGSLNI